MSKRWVINLSSQPLTEAEKNYWPMCLILLLHLEAPHYRMHYHHRRGMPETGTRQSRRVEGRSESHSENLPSPKPNITREEQKAMEQLRKDDTRILLTVDKGVDLVVMNRGDYEKKAEELLSQTTYNNINNDPTTRYKNKLINLLKTIKTPGGISEALYKSYTQLGQGCQNFMDSPRCIKRRHL